MIQRMLVRNTKINSAFDFDECNQLLKFLLFGRVNNDGTHFGKVASFACWTVTPGGLDTHATDDTVAVRFGGITGWTLVTINTMVVGLEHIPLAQFTPMVEWLAILSL